MGDKRKVYTLIYKNLVSWLPILAYSSSWFAQAGGHGLLFHFVKTVIRCVTASVEIFRFGSELLQLTNQAELNVSVWASYSRFYSRFTLFTVKNWGSTIQCNFRSADLRVDLGELRFDKPRDLQFYRSNCTRELLFDGSIAGQPQQLNREWLVDGLTFSMNWVSDSIHQSSENWGHFNYLMCVLNKICYSPGMVVCQGCGGY